MEPASNVISFEVDPGSLVVLPRVNIVGGGDYLDKEPEPIQWLVPGLLPLGVPTVLASQGGLGKSFLTLQLAIAVSTGKQFLDFDAPDGPRGAVYFGLEDGRETVHRRVRAIVALYREANDWTLADDAAFRANFTTCYVNWSVDGATSFLPDLIPNINLLMDIYANRKIKPGVVALDTLARFSDGDENTVQGLRPVLNACSKLADRGWTSLMLHHVGKGQDGAKTGKEKPTLADRMSTDWVRGTGSIVANFRCVLQFAKILECEADGAGVDPEVARLGQVLVLGVTKFNGGPRGDWRVILQDDHGRWSASPESAETLAKLRGAKAVMKLTKQMGLLVDLHQATRGGSEPDLAGLIGKHFGETKNPKTAFKQAAYNLRNSNLIQRNSYQLTVQGLQRLQSVTGVTGQGGNDE